MKAQFSFKDLNSSPVHGGDLSRGKRKAARPIATKKAMHLVLRSDHAIGKLSFPHHEKSVRNIFGRQAKLFHVQVYQLVLNTNHMHVLIKAQTRDGFKSFLRAVTGIIARLLLKASQMPLTHFWTSTVFSRVVEWGRAFKIVRRYLLQNELEAHGIIPYQPRGRTRKRTSSDVCSKSNRASNSSHLC